MRTIHQIQIKTSVIYQNCDVEHCNYTGYIDLHYNITDILEGIIIPHKKSERDAYIKLEGECPPTLLG